MSSLPHPCVDVHTSEAPHPSVPTWFAESVLVASYLQRHALLSTFAQQVRLVRGRFGHYEVLDFLALLFGYAISGERTLHAYFAQMESCAEPFMALFERTDCPHRATLSRFLTDVDAPCLAAFRAVFEASTFTWGWTAETIGGIWDRVGHRYLVFDIDGTRQAARQRALPQGAELPPAHRRLEEVCAVGYKGRRRGEVVRTRTTVLQMHTRQWLGTFGGRGNGDYRGELRAALQVVLAYLNQWQMRPAQGLIRVDGQYGDATVIAEIVALGLHVIVRKRGDAVLAHPRLQAVLTEPPIAVLTGPRVAEVFDVLEMVLEEGMPAMRLIVVRHAWNGEKIAVGKVIGEWVYEQFVTTLAPEGFRATDILDLYHGRGAFEGTLADEDREGDPDRWCSYLPDGQELWQVVWQWVWNLRLALQLSQEATPLRAMEWAPPIAPVARMVAVPTQEEEPTYGPIEWARAWGRAHDRMGAAAFTLREDGLLQCPTDHLLWLSEIRQETPTSQRLVYMAQDDDCADCSLRAACLGRSASGKRGRRVSARRQQMVTAVTLVPYPLAGTEAMLWRDVAGRHLRRTWMTFWRRQTVTLVPLPTRGPTPPRPPRAARAHVRLRWDERMARNARSSPCLTTIHVSGVASSLIALLSH